MIHVGAMSTEVPGGMAPHRYSKEEARAIFQKSVMNGSHILTAEARKRMRERKVDDTNDILELARSGLVCMEPEPHAKTGAWIYRIESQNITPKACFEVVGPEKVRLLTVLN